MEPIVKSNKIVLVGVEKGRDKCLSYQNTDYEIWCISHLYEKYRFSTLVFDVHDKECWFKSTYLAEEDKKLISTYEETTYTLPVEDLIKEFNGLLTSSYNWMLAYAIYRNVKEIVIFGIDLTEKWEFENTRSSFYYLLGIAKAKEIKIILDNESGLV